MKGTFVGGLVVGIVWGSNGGTIKPNCQQLTQVQ